MTGFYNVFHNNPKWRDPALIIFDSNSIAELCYGMYAIELPSRIIYRVDPLVKTSFMYGT